MTATVYGGGRGGEAMGLWQRIDQEVVTIQNVFFLKQKRQSPTCTKNPQADIMQSSYIAHS